MDKETRVPKDRTDQATIQGLDTTLVTKDGMDKPPMDSMDKDNKPTMDNMDKAIIHGLDTGMDKDKAATDSMDKDNMDNKDSMDMDAIFLSEIVTED